MSRFTENPDEIVLQDIQMFHLESMNERTLDMTGFVNEKLDEIGA